MMHKYWILNKFFHWKFNKTQNQFSKEIRFYGSKTYILCKSALQYVFNNIGCISELELRTSFVDASDLHMWLEEWGDPNNIYFWMTWHLVTL
jgi:hypothetical protein